MCMRGGYCVQRNEFYALKRRLANEFEKKRENGKN